jgi:ABC-2 type transport system ATP-binding protein
MLGGDVVTLEVEGDISALLGNFRKQDWVRTATAHDGLLSLTVEKGERRIPELIEVARMSGVKVTCAHLRKPSLEDVFLHFTGRTIRDQQASQAERNRAMMRNHFRRGR